MNEMINLKRVLLLLAVVFSFALLQPRHSAAFSPPGSTSVKTDASTQLSYRNYDDIIMIGSISDATPPSAVTAVKKAKIVTKHGSKSGTSPKLKHDKPTFTALDVDADRMPLSILLAPPEAPFTNQEANTSHLSSRAISTASRTATRASPITQIFNIQDYNQHVLNSPHNQLCIIRFHAPWCQVCRTTNVYWERMASKISKMNSSNRSVKFLSVTLDGSNEEVAKLKDLLQIDGVPQGVFHHASDGVSGQKVNLNRKMLGNLNKQLECYLKNDMGADMFLYGLKKEK
jgi:hypothetical protein